MQVKIIDIDNKYRNPNSRGKRFPNLAATKVSAYWKSRKASVDFNINNPDLTYIFCVFTKNSEFARKEVQQVTGRVVLGGSGISLSEELPPEIERMKPDYNLYPFQEFSFGFTTRGCFRKECEDFCIVRKKEGPLRKSQHIREFHDFRFKSCTLLDNNILGIPDWFFENTDWAIDHKVKLNITQGMDIRLVNDEIAEQLARIKFVDQQMRFAWDFLEIEDSVVNGIQTLKNHGINVRRNVAFYVLSGFKYPFCKDLYRCNRLKELGVRSFVMPYKETLMIKAMARWANRVRTYWLMPFYQYDRMPIYKNSSDIYQVRGESKIIDFPG